MACLQKSQQLVTAGLYTTDAMIITSCTLTAIINYRNRGCFHPFFSTLFSLFLISYAISDIFEVSSFITSRYVGNISLLTELSEFFYFYASPCAVLLLIERFVASCFPMQYEKARPWKAFWLAQPICLLISYGVIYSARITISSEDDIQQAILFVIQLFIAVMVVVLMIYNRWRTKKSIGIGTKLTTRYQLAENIRALKILIPVIFFDLSLTICDILSRVMLVVAAETNCSLGVFGIFYVIFKFASFLCQLCVPISFIFFHPVFKRYRKIRSLFHLKSQGDERVVIRSVLGTTINRCDNTDDYFSSLRKKWDK
ncbi:hypothetical protein V3C99_016318 [Haemonchus contortus]